MSYGVLCTFDLAGASSTDYQNAYSDLEKLGLYRAQSNSGGGKTVIPTTTVLGSYNGASADAIRDDVRAKIKAAFTARRFKSEIFVVVGGKDWTWGAATS
ncbi:MAG: hypothetical protein AABY68_13030 [Pseudomonadota bacterium]|mgnify:CR=1 FL=1